jgi:hypothetical protein
MMVRMAKMTFECFLNPWKGLKAMCAAPFSLALPRHPACSSCRDDTPCRA